jgi:hypothetical protein
MLKRKIVILQTVFYLYTIFIFAFTLRAEDSPSLMQQPPNFYVQLGWIPTSLGVGAVLKQHKFGIYGSSYWSFYQAVGAEYAYHLADVNQDGFYGKLYSEYQKFDHNLTVSSENSNGSWKEENINKRTSIHTGALVGYQKIISDRAFVNIGVGWQYNNHPVKVDSTALGGQSMRSWTEVTGEFVLGFLL